MKNHYSAALPSRIRILTVVIVAVALAAGGWLRFARLAARDMSADEGASWAAAAAPSVGQVLLRHSHLNPATFGLDDAALHLWMRAFGDGLATMRAMAASAGTLAVLFVFAVTRELLQLEDSGALASTRDAGKTRVSFVRAEVDLVAAVAALVFAVNLVTIKYSREARMYPLLLIALLVQFTCFVRASGRGGFANYIGAAIFTPIAVALHPCALFAFAVEGLWILYLLWCSRFSFGAIESRRALGLITALIVGTALLAPAIPRTMRAGSNAASHGVFTWISRPEWWELFALFNKATGSVAFPVMAALAAWGVVSGWRRARAGVKFLLLWMWVPPIIVMIVSYVMRPAFVERYLLPSFIPFFILVAIGIWELPRLRYLPRFECLPEPPVRDLSTRAQSAVRAGAAMLVVALALGHVHSYDRKQHGAQWREAAEVAADSLRHGDQIVVAPGYAANVVRYYLRNGTEAAAPHPADSSDPVAAVAIIADQGVDPAIAARLRHLYPHPLARLRGLSVRRR